MKVSIFKGKNNHKKAEQIVIKKRDDLYDIIQQHTWSPATFRNGERANKNFEETSLMVLDIDNAIPLATALAQLKLLGYTCIVGTSRNHQKEKNGVVTDRYRLIFPLSSPISKAEDFVATWKALSFVFPETDPQCKDPARLYYPCAKVALHEGFRKLDVTKSKDLEENKKIRRKRKEGEIGVLSFKTQKFLKDGCESGNWHHEFLCAARDIKSQGYSYEETYKLLEKITGKLDKEHDEVQLDYIFKDDENDFEFRPKEEKR